MAAKVIAGTPVEVNEEGYLVDASQWNRDMATEIAREVDIQELTDDHWKVIDFLRRDAEEKGGSPTIRRLKKAGGIDTKLLYELFPGGPLKKATKIAGLPKPASCI
ncbi:TusE/DsrC/DsvC family sulfur relay protein [bacterium]|nr:TusE/DsrC/DsvC family sulfur relay protein [bacterium]